MERVMARGVPPALVLTFGVVGIWRADYRVSSSLSGPVDPSFRALSGRLESTVRPHKFIEDIPLLTFGGVATYGVVVDFWRSGDFWHLLAGYCGHGWDPAAHRPPFWLRHPHPGGFGAPFIKCQLASRYEL